MTEALRRYTNVRREEVWPVLASAFLSREDKYKSKAFIDTFVCRGGDVMGAWTEGLLGRLGFALFGLAALAVPLALVWAGLGLWLGLTQRRIARDRGHTGAPAPAVASISS